MSEIIQVYEEAEIITIKVPKKLKIVLEGDKKGKKYTKDEGE